LHGDCRKFVGFHAMALNKIVSGGQTGVDRGALEAALRAGFPCGGWAPADGQAEGGPIPQRYPLTSLPGGGYPERTRENVLTSDGTVILFDGRLTNGHVTRGTRLTRLCCKEARKPLLIVDRAKTSEADGAAAILNFIKANGISILNVAGPRASGWPEGFDFALEVLSRVFKFKP
jgi:Circularly permutated YpsA SLOG family